MRERDVRKNELCVRNFRAKDDIISMSSSKGSVIVTVSYKKLWKLLIDKDMTKTDLRLAIGASSSTFSKLAHGEFISGDLTGRICEALQCNVGDIMDVVLGDEHSSEGGLPGDRLRMPHADA